MVRERAHRIIEEPWGQCLKSLLINLAPGRSIESIEPSRIPGLLDTVRASQPKLFWPEDAALALETYDTVTRTNHPRYFTLSGLQARKTALVFERMQLSLAAFVSNRAACRRWLHRALLRWSPGSFHGTAGKPCRLSSRSSCLLFPEWGGPTAVST